MTRFTWLKSGPDPKGNVPNWGVFLFTDWLLLMVIIHVICKLELRLSLENRFLWLLLGAFLTLAILSLLPPDLEVPLLDLTWYLMSFDMTYLPLSACNGAIYIIWMRCQFGFHIALHNTQKSGWNLNLTYMFTISGIWMISGLRLTWCNA